MAKQFSELSEKHKEFIQEQKIFFVGTATEDSRVNISPKGMDSFRVLGPNRVAWLNVTGSGNETAAHLTQTPRITIMFTAFEGNPLILRLYGTAKAVHPKDEKWLELAPLFPELPGARQIFDCQIDMVQNSCGMAVPFYEYEGPREQLNDWANKQGEQGIQAYWEKKNQYSIDGIATDILEK